MRGKGGDARVTPVRWNGLSSGASRFFVTVSPQEAVSAAAAQLAAEGFTNRGDEFDQKLRAAGSEWVAQDLLLGDIRKSWKQGLVAWVADGVGLDLFPAFWRPVTPTLVVACARSVPEGTELVIYPHVSIRGGADSNDAFPLVRRAVAALEERFTGQGAFISREKMRGIKNDGSPASQKVVKDLLGWT